MKITTITRENLSFFKNFISLDDAKFINEDLKILPIGLVADDLEKRKNLAAGAICIRPDDFMLNISSFYIAPEYRGKGGGRFLLDETKRLFGKKNMEFNVEFLIYDKEQEDFANFLEHYGFMSADPEYDCYLTTVGELKNTKLYGKEGEGIDFSSISPQTFKLTENNAENNDAMLPLGGFSSPRIDRDVSVGIEKNGIMESYVVFETTGKNNLILTAVHSKDKSPVILLHMLEKSAALLKQKYTKDSKILIQSADNSTDVIIGNVFEDATDISCRYVYEI